MHQNLNSFFAIRKIFFSAFILTLFELSACADGGKPEKFKHDFINTSMIGLVSNPEKYSGKTVLTVAYINIDGGQLTAYPSRDAYLSRDNATAFSLDLDPKLASELAGHYKNRYCLIQGKVFYLDEPFYEFIKLGKLTDVKVITSTDFPRDDPGSRDIYIDKLKDKESR